MLVESIFPTTFNYLIASGFWLPTNFDDKFKPFYYVLGLFSWLSDMMLLIPMIMYAVLSEESFSKLMIDNLFFLATLLNWLAKTTYLLIRRSNVIDVAYKCGHVRWTQFRDEKEDEIIRESKKSENFISRYCGAMVSANIISNVLRPVTSANPEHKLVVDAYEFCDRSQSSCFWSCYLAQSVGFFFAAVFIVGYDCLLYNLILRCSAHFAVVAHRMQRFRQGVTRITERSYYRDCFRDHQAALIIVDDLCRIFAETVFLQFCSSILVICTTVFFLSKQEPMSPDFVSTAVYLFCMLVQTFLYCWFGYKLTEINPKMTDAIYQIDWVNLQNKTKKMIRFMLLMTSRKIEPFDNAFVSLSPVSFINIVKLSYSTFMVLTKTS